MELDAKLRMMATELMDIDLLSRLSGGDIIALFKSKAPSLSKGKQQIKNLKNDCNLFSQLYISSAYRDGNLVEFFKHENLPWPPSLSDEGDLYLPSKKSDLLHLSKSGQPVPPALYHASVYEGASMVHSLPLKTATTFGEYAEIVFLPWLRDQMKYCQRLDVIWDRYNKESLKETTRNKRGSELRRKVSETRKLPKHFADFLKDSKKTKKSSLSF